MRTVRIIYDDPEATDSSEEDQEFPRKQQRNESCSKQFVKEVCFQVVPREPVERLQKLKDAEIHPSHSDQKSSRRSTTRYPGVRRRGWGIRDPFTGGGGRRLWLGTKAYKDKNEESERRKFVERKKLYFSRGPFRDESDDVLDKQYCLPSPSSVLDDSALNFPTEELKGGEERGSYVEKLRRECRRLKEVSGTFVGKGLEVEQYELSNYYDDDDDDDVAVLLECMGCVWKCDVGFGGSAAEVIDLPEVELDGDCGWIDQFYSEQR